MYNLLANIHKLIIIVFQFRNRRVKEKGLDRAKSPKMKSAWGLETLRKLKKSCLWSFTSKRCCSDKHVLACNYCTVSDTIYVKLWEVIIQQCVTSCLVKEYLQTLLKGLTFLSQVSYFLLVFTITNALQWVTADGTGNNVIA